MARTQTLVQLSDSLLGAVDEVAARLKRSRSDLIREALERYLAETRETEIDRQIVEGYKRQPPGEIWGDEVARRLIKEEPW